MVNVLAAILAARRRARHRARRLRHAGQAGAGRRARSSPCFLLKTFDAKFWGVVVMGGAVMILFFLPWLDRSPVKSIRYRPDWHKYVYGVFVVFFLVLGYLGSQPPSTAGNYISQVGTLLLRLLPADAVVEPHRHVQAGARARHLPRALMAAGAHDEKTPAQPARRPAASRCRRSRQRRRLSVGPASRSTKLTDRGRAAERRAHLRQLLPELPLGGVHALQPPARHRPDRRRRSRRTCCSPPTRSAT